MYYDQILYHDILYIMIITIYHDYRGIIIITNITHQ